ncbi:MAG: ABC transporter permease subunit [Clostridiales bacterium]|nr:ABC transporter permease subunit [Clostridiales bacterium]
MRNKLDEVHYHIMLLPGMVMLAIFCIVPMFGIVMAFQNFVPAKGIFGSQFVGLSNFRLMFTFPDVKLVFFNTIYIAVFKIALGLLFPVLFALLLNEVRVAWFKRTVQTIAYLPNFLSWVILAVMFSNIFSFTGVFNQIIQFFGGEPVLFLASNKWFRPILIATDVWKGFGYGAIIYLAAITNIDSSQYEAADIDGATRFQKVLHVTLPGMQATVVLMATLALGNVLNAGFEQIFSMYTPIVYQTSDIIDTYVYRMGLVQLQFSFGTAVGLLKSVVSFVLIVLSYKLADRFAGYRIF